jgi:hypothetical protein
MVTSKLPRHAVDVNLHQRNLESHLDKPITSQTPQYSPARNNTEYMHGCKN